MKRTVSAVKDTRRRRSVRSMEVRRGFVEATKGGVKWDWKTG